MQYSVCYERKGKNNSPWSPLNNKPVLMMFQHKFFFQDYKENDILGYDRQNFNDSQRKISLSQQQIYSTQRDLTQHSKYSKTLQLFSYFISKTDVKKRFSAAVHSLENVSFLTQKHKRLTAHTFFRKPNYMNTANESMWWEIFHVAFLLYRQQMTYNTEYFIFHEY